jgi:hypothetical protein
MGLSLKLVVVDGVSSRQFSQEWFVAPVIALSVTQVNHAGVMNLMSIGDNKVLNCKIVPAHQQFTALLVIL